MNAVRQGILDAKSKPQDITCNKSIAQAFIFTPDFVGFSGHFPDEPILPAVVQIGIGIALAEMLLPADATHSLILKYVRRAKFIRKLVPEEVIMGQCRVLDYNGLQVDVSLSVNQEPASSFVLEFCLQQKRKPDA
jgi:3-hydroxyacyl-[acyl-carrier-protein] dehydratase